MGFDVQGMIQDMIKGPWNEDLNCIDSHYSAHAVIDGPWDEKVHERRILQSYRQNSLHAA